MQTKPMEYIIKFGKNFSLILQISFLIGCSSINHNSVEKYSYLHPVPPSLQYEINRNKKKDKKYIQSFEVFKGENPESIFNKLSILNKKIYLIENGKDFTMNISTDKIKTEKDLVLFFKVQGYNLAFKKIGRYTKVYISKIRDEAYNKLLKIHVELKGYAPFDKVFQKLISDTGIIYNPNDLGNLASSLRNFYFKGNLADAIIYASNLIGADLEFDGNKLTLSKLKTVLLNFEYPIQDTDFTANITNSTGTSSSGKDSQPISSLVSRFKSNIAKQINNMLNSKKSKEGNFYYIPEVGQISFTDYPNNIAKVTKIINDLNNKFKEQIKIEFKFYKYTTTIVKDRGINLSGKINDFINYGFKSGTLGTSIKNISDTKDSGLGLGFNDNTTSAILKYLNTYGKAEIEHSFSFLITNNTLDVLKIGSNRGYLEKIDTTIGEGGVVSTEMTPSSISDGTFVAAFARALSGDKIAVNLFLTINDLKEFVDINSQSSNGGTKIQVPYTDEQSFSSTKIFQNNVPYIINHYELKSKNNKKSAIPLIEDTFLDPIASDKNDNIEKTYIITEIKVSRGY